MTARLIVTADDVGLDRGMTAGAIRAHQEGIVTACSVVANGVDFDDAVARLRDVPTLEVGVHLALVEERALTTGEAMPRNYVRFLLSRRRDPEGELRAQIEKVLASGLRVTHVNGHQHLHMLPSVFTIVQRLAAEYQIGYVRRVVDVGGRAGVGRRMAIGVLNALGRRANGTNDATLGVMEAGHLTSERIVDLLARRRLAGWPGGVPPPTELVTHPGLNVTRYPHWHYDWDTETHALCDPRVREALEQYDVQLIAPSAAGGGTPPGQPAGTPARPEMCSNPPPP